MPYHISKVYEDKDFEEYSRYESTRRRIEKRISKFEKSLGGSSADFSFCDGILNKIRPRPVQTRYFQIQLEVFNHV